MNLIVLKLLLLGGQFALSLVMLLLPQCLQKSKKQDTAGAGGSSVIMAFLNSFSDGVLLGTAIIALIPASRDHLEEILAIHEIETRFPLIDVLLLSGVFLVLAIEDLAHKCQARKASHSTGQPLSQTTTQSLSSVVSDDGSDDELSLDDESAAMITHRDRPKKRRNKDKTTESSGNGMYQQVSLGDSEAHHHGDAHHHQPAGHGHSHDHAMEAFQGQDSKFRAMLVFLALGVHSVFEGVTFGLLPSSSAIWSLTFAIGLHEALIAFALGVNILRVDFSRATLGLMMTLFCGMIPVGGVIGVAVGTVKSYKGQLAGAMLQVVSAGTFLHVVFIEMLPASLGDHRWRFMRILTMIGGCLVIALLPLVGMDSHQ